MSGASDLANRAAHKVTELADAGAHAAQHGVEDAQRRVGESAASAASTVHDAADQLAGATRHAADVAQRGVGASRMSSARARAAVGAALVGLVAIVTAVLRRRSE
jgi:hypothetical protein